ncbi:hypothetical protein NPIL_384031, partial [Nephila pilipes]
VKSPSTETTTKLYDISSIKKSVARRGDIPPQMESMIKQFHISSIKDTVANVPPTERSLKQKT